MAASKGEKLIDAAITAISRLEALSRKPHSRRDLCDVVDGVATRMEAFLRTAALPASSKGDVSKDLIARLSTLSLDPQSISNLQALRSVYNKSKHQPLAPILLADVRATVVGALHAFRNLADLGVPGIDAPAVVAVSHHLWIAGWDHLMGGETEVVIALPSSHWTHIATVDNFHLHWQAWDALKLVLADQPNFKWGPEHFDSEVWLSLTREGEFLDAGVWDGDYGELLRIIARFHDDTKMRAVLPDLQRGRNRISIGAAIITAAIDVARASRDPCDASQLGQLVASRAAVEYAITIDADHRAVVQVAEFIAGLPHGSWARLSGPLIVDKNWISSLQQVAGPLPMAVDGDWIALAFSPD